MGFNVGALSNDSLKVVARIVKTDSKYKEYINNFCQFEDPQFVDYLFVKIGGRSLDWGDIEDIEIHKNKKKEIWKIKTTKGKFQLQVLEKPEWVDIEINKRVITDELSARRRFKNLLKGDILSMLRLDKLAKVVFPWKI